MRRDAQNALEIVKEKIEGIDWFRQHNVTVMLQNDQDVASLINRELSQIEGVLVLLAVDRESNLGQGGSRIDMTAICTESVALNRLDADHATAIDVAEQIGYRLDSDEIHWNDISHSSPDLGVLTATASLWLILQTLENTNGE